MIKKYVIKLVETDKGVYSIPEECVIKNAKVDIILGYNVAIIEIDDTDEKAGVIQKYAITEEEYEKIKQEFNQKMKVMRGEIVNE